MADYVILDIETAPLPDLPEPPEHLIEKVPANVTKAETIEKRKQENREAWYADAALDPRKGQVVAVGLGYGTNGRSGTDSWIAIQNEPDGQLSEEWLIAECYAELGGSRSLGSDRMAVVGFNLRSFDLWFLQHRAAVLGITPTRKFDRAKYRQPSYSRPEIPWDWCELLADWDYQRQKGWTLDYYAKFYGFKAQPFGKSKEVPERWVAGDYDYVRKHLEADLAMIREMHERWAAYYV